jgi:hypothetical protein
MVTQCVNLADVWMDQLRRKISFVAEHSDKVIVLSKMRKDSLEYQQLSVGVASGSRKKDLRHAARRKLCDELIVAEVSGVAGHHSARWDRHSFIVSQRCATC